MARTHDEEARAFWREVLGEHPTPEQIEAELHDFYILIQEVPKVYDEVTNGRFTKPTTAAEYIIARVEELQNEAVTEAEGPLRAALVLICGHLATVDTETNWLVKRDAIRRLAHEALGVEAITPEMLAAALAQP